MDKNDHHGIIFDLPDLEATTNRLLRNAPDFARLFCRFYENETAAELNRLLTDHLVIAAEFVKSAKAGNNSVTADAEKRWYANADDIVCFLNHINSYWSVEHMRSMWYLLTSQSMKYMLNSIPIEFLPSFAATSNVVPESEKGSSVIPLTGQPANMQGLKLACLI